MSGRAVAISNYSFKPEHKLLIDANVWLFVYGPGSPRDRKSRIYSQALKRMMQAESHIFIDILIISEFINRYSRIKFNLIKRKNQNFKRFRRSKDFEPIAKEVAEATNQLLKCCELTGKSLNKLQINRLLNEYTQGKSDFNDQVIAAICKRENLKLVTDDIDFKGGKISVLTANKKMLNDWQ